MHDSIIEKSEILFKIISMGYEMYFPNYNHILTILFSAGLALVVNSKKYLSEAQKDKRFENLHSSIL